MPQALLYNVWHPKMRRLYRYWEELRGARAMPGRVDIDPIDVPDLLPRILLINVHWDPLSFSDRLVGSTADELMESETLDPATGEPADVREVLPALWRECSETGAPARRDVEAGLQGRIRAYECLALPLSDDGVTVNMLLAGIWPKEQGGMSRRMRALGERPTLRLVIDAAEPAAGPR